MRTFHCNIHPRDGPADEASKRAKVSTWFGPTPGSSWSNQTTARPSAFASSVSTRAYRRCFESRSKDTSTFEPIMYIMFDKIFSDTVWLGIASTCLRSL